MVHLLGCNRKSVSNLRDHSLTGRSILMDDATIIRAQTELLTDYEIELYREDVGILSEDLLRTDTNPYFEEDE